jgi:organic hydroperoxide reductase OsmC/OhrA
MVVMGLLGLVVLLMVVRPLVRRVLAPEKKALAAPPAQLVDAIAPESIEPSELRPKITWSGNRRPSAEELDKMHHAAHENCFIANSVKTNVTVAEQ